MSLTMGNVRVLREPQALIVVLAVLSLHCSSPVVKAQEAGRPPISYRLQEEQSPASFVGNVATASGLPQKYPDSYSQLQYDFLDTSSDFKSFFSISGGTLTAQRTIDRDEICPRLVKCEFNLDVRAQLIAENIFEIIPVMVEIEDMNDNTPTFPKLQIERTLLESSPPGTTIRIQPANDPDSPRYGISRYVLDALPDVPFELKKTSNPDGTVDIQLVLKEPLDREVKGSYQMEVVAYDADTPPKIGSMTVNINVKDINDNHPVFDNTTYEVFVQENVPEFTTIHQVRALDPDEGLSGQVAYAFTTRTEDQFGTMFGIEELSGEIFVRKVLDYEEGDTYNLDVIASDRSPQDALTAVAKVVVHVRDLNDHAPQITMNTEGDEAFISENEAAGTFVVHITVRDVDGGENGRFNCSLTDTDNFKLQKVYKTEYKIVTRVVFDREMRTVYEPALHCHDFGTPQLTSTLRIKVLIKDENDHQPLFNKTVYSTTLAENNLLDAPVVTVTATDGDQGDNARVRYTLPDETARRFFNIDPNTGNITAKVSLDYEYLKEEGLTSMEIVVVASDTGYPAQTAIATVRVDVIDKDDVVPQFSKTSYIFGVLEGEPANTFVGQVNATDPDSSPANRFMFSLDAKFNSENAFRVDTNNGRIYTRKMLDRELSGVYHLVVIATSTGSPDQTNTTNVFVSVLDENDNSPIVDFPSPLNNTVYVSEDVPVGFVVTRINARDADSGDNSKLTYNITAGNEKGLFAMNMYTGAVLAAASLKYVADNERYFTLFINVHDNGQPVRFFETLLNIVVNKSADVSPQGLISNNNLTIVITIACISGVVMVFLVVAIVFIVLSQRRNARKKYNYMPRLADQKLAADKAAGDGGGSNNAGGGSSRVDNNTAAKKNLNTGGSPHKTPHGKMNGSFDLKNKDLEKYELQDANLMGQHGTKVPSSPYKQMAGFGHEATAQKPWLLPNNTQLQKGPVLNGYVAANDKADSDSACSADMSNATDSGHGSNEGDGSENLNHYRPSSPPGWDPTMRTIQEGSDLSPIPSPSKDNKGLSTRALAPGVHRKSSGNSRRDSDRERPTRPTGGGQQGHPAGHRPHPPAPPRRVPSHQSDSSSRSEVAPHLVLQPDSGYHGNGGNMSRTGGQWNLANHPSGTPIGQHGLTASSQQLPHRDGFYYASHV